MAARPCTLPPPPPPPSISCAAGSLPGGTQVAGRPARRGVQPPPLPRSTATGRSLPRFPGPRQCPRGDEAGGTSGSTLAQGSAGHAGATGGGEEGELGGKKGGGDEGRRERWIRWGRERSLLDLLPILGLTHVADGARILLPMTSCVPLVPGSQTTRNWWLSWKLPGNWPPPLPLPLWRTATTVCAYRGPSCVRVQYCSSPQTRRLHCWVRGVQQGGRGRGGGRVRGLPAHCFLGGGLMEELGLSQMGEGMRQQGGGRG